MGSHERARVAVRSGGRRPGGLRRWQRSPAAAGLESPRAARDSRWTLLDRVGGGGARQHTRLRWSEPDLSLAGTARAGPRAVGYEPQLDCRFYGGGGCGLQRVRDRLNGGGDTYGRAPDRARHPVVAGGLGQPPLGRPPPPRGGPRRPPAPPTPPPPGGGGRPPPPIFRPRTPFSR